MLRQAWAIIMAGKSAVSAVDVDFILRTLPNPK
jgi:hypothetical protein